MTIEIETIEATTPAWDDLVRRVDAGTFFHQQEVLEVVAAHSGSTLHRLVGFKGDQPIGLFPIFERSVGPVTMAFSPPPRQYVPGLGPLLLHPEQLKRAKRERRNRRFIEACLAWLEDELTPRYVRIESVPGYADPRPFAWQGFTVTPLYTYHVDLTGGEEAVLNRFKKSLRSDIRRSRDGDYTIERGDEVDIGFILEQLRARHAAQGESFTLSDDYVLDLRHAAVDGRFAVYVARIDDERVSGIISPRFASTMHYWQGGGKPDVSLPINDLLHWAIIRDGMRDGREVYDLVGANTPRLCRYKSKFNPELRTYYAMERGTPFVSALAGFFRWVK